MGWYTFFVRTGKEENVYEYLDCILGDYIETSYKMLIPKREITEYKSGKKSLVYKTLFPGYILIHTNSILEIYNAIRHHYHLEQYSLLRTEGYFHEIRFEEINIILKIINHKGIIDTSTIFLEKDRVIITEGSLANYKGIIKKVNARKGRAKILIQFLNRSCEIDIGVKCLSKLENEDIKNVIFF